MSHDRVVTVASAKIAFGYYAAACLKECTVTRTAGAWSLVASVVSVNELWLARQPLTFVVTHQHGSWTWPVVEMPQIAGGSLSVNLGPPEVPDGYARQAQDRQVVAQ